jgi:phospholipid/cholesterol/gamma-HCH transport system ATP-binding protein
MFNAMELNEQNKKSIVVVKDLRKRFGDNVVLDGFNLELFQGENLVVMGKSGSGKSVMIKCLIGLEEPDEGSIEVMNQNIKQLSREALDELRTEVGFLFQGSALYDSMSVRENLEFPLRRHTQKFGNIQDTTPLVMEALESVGLGDTIDLMPNELSGGMKRRIALARTLILKPKIILYDEPTTGLDPITSKEILMLMISVQKKYNTSSIIITHDVDCARMISNRMILLIDGINYAEGTLRVCQAPKIQKCRHFLNEIISY